VSLRSVSELVGYRVLAALVRRLPLSCAQKIFGWLAGLLFDLQGKRVGWVLTNLRLAFPDLPASERRRIGRASYVHLAWNMVDFIRAERWSDEEILARIEFEGVDHLREALKQGNGALGLCLHLGNFELVNLAAPLYGIRAAVVARPMANRFLYAHILGQRSRTGNLLLNRRGAARDVLAALRSGLAVGILPDQYARRARAVFVPMFGLRCSTSAGPAALALRASAPVVPVYVVRDAPGHHRVRFEPALEPPSTGDLQSDIEAYTARMNATLERIIRAHPEQYMWAHRRFRHSPDLSGNPYK
jgi:KDO2-lipid IV(A) lauroyltransferase